MKQALKSWCWELGLWAMVFGSWCLPSTACLGPVSKSRLGMLLKG